MMRSTFLGSAARALSARAIAPVSRCERYSTPAGERYSTDWAVRGITTVRAMRQDAGRRRRTAEDGIFTDRIMHGPSLVPHPGVFRRLSASSGDASRTGRRVMRETDREGFEPSMPLRAYRFSRPAVSTAHPPVQTSRGREAERLSGRVKPNPSYLISLSL